MKSNIRKTVWVMALLAGFAIFALGTGTAQANLITNGDFATDSSGWTGGGECYSGPIWSAFGNPGGSALLNDCGWTTSDPWISQTVSGLTVGATYDLDWELFLHYDWGGSSVSGLSFGVFLDGAVIDLSEQLTFSWVGDSLSFTATAPSHTLMFAAELDARTPGVGGTTDVSYYIDNINMVQSGPTPVPEPSTMLLLGSGLAGLAGFRKRFKVKTS